MTDALAPRNTHYRVLRTITKDIDQEIAGSHGRPWEGTVLGQAQDVRKWIDDPSKVDSRIVGSLQLASRMLRRGGRLLDVGCYGGYAYDYLHAEKGFLYVGIDIDPNVVAAARAAHTGTAAQFETGDLFDLGHTIERHKPFDLALCLRVVIHTPWLDRALIQLMMAAPVALVGLRVASEDSAVEIIDSVSGQTYFFRVYCRDTIERSIPKGVQHKIFEHASYSTLVLTRETR